MAQLNRVDNIGILVFSQTRRNCKYCQYCQCCVFVKTPITKPNNNLLVAGHNATREWKVSVVSVCLSVHRGSPWDRTRWQADFWPWNEGPSCFVDVVVTIESEEPYYEYLYQSLNWTNAEVKCECLGNLPILDTKEKAEHFLSTTYVCQYWTWEDQSLRICRKRNILRSNVKWNSTTHHT